jgi:hypothetical protein
MRRQRNIVEVLELAFFATAIIWFSSSSFANDLDEWTTKNVGVVINSPDHDAFPNITKDGLALYFSRGYLDKADGSKVESWWDVEDWDIYVSTRPDTNSPWGEPVKLPDHINTDGEDHSVSLSTDGHWMYFSSNKLDTCGGLDIFRAYRDDVTDHLAWGVPENLGCDVNTEQADVCVIYHQEENSETADLYFVSNREGSKGHVDAWRVGFDPKSGRYTDAENVLAVSSPGFDGHLDPEAGYVWTERDGGFGGSDIWHSDRDDEGNWLPPTNLGSSINTEYEEQLPAPFDHGRIIYFPSDRPGGSGNLDIYIAEKDVSKN